jgi:ACS family hexuronate transporter-like MFS transporter
MSRASYKLPNLRWLIAPLLFLNTVSNYVDRQALAILVPRLTLELKITNVEYGYITQAFLISYTAMYLGSGILVDRWGVRLVYAIATIWWSAAAMLHALARSAFSLGAFQFLLGMGESCNFIAAQKVTAEWYPVTERGTVNGLVQAGAVTGSIVAPPMVVLLMTYAGWRAVFVVTGFLGFLWVAAWLLLYFPPESHPLITRSELALVRGNPTETSQRSGVKRLKWIELLRMRETWGLLVSRIFSDPVWWFYIFWLPKYLTEARAFSIREVGLTAWVPYLFSDIGSLFGGWLSGRLVARGWGVVRARKLVMLCSALVMPFGAVVAFTNSAIAIAAISLVLFAYMSWKTNLVTLTVDLYPESVVGSVSGLVGIGSGIGGAVFTATVGYLIQWHSYTPVFLFMAALNPIAYAFVRWTIPDNPSTAIREPVARQTL